MTGFNFFAHLLVVKTFISYNNIEKLLLKNNQLYENEITLFNIISSHRTLLEHELIVRIGVHKLT